MLAGNVHSGSCGVGIRMHRQLVFSRFQLLFPLIGWLGAALGVSAQTSVRPPDAGALQQQIDRERQQPVMPRGDIPSWNGLSRVPDVKDQTVIPVERFVFQGNTLLSQQVLSQLLQGRTFQRLSFLELQMAAEQVMQAYREAGWMAYAYLPEQDVTAGQVTIQIVEATMGDLVVRSDPSQRISEDHIRQIFQAQQIRGEALRIQALDRALLLVSDLPGTTVKGGLSEWASGSASRDVVLELSSSPLRTGDVGLDNSGARSTGRERAQANIHLNSPMGRGDLTSLSAVKSEGSTYLRVDVSWPVGYQGWRIGLYDAHLSYRIVSPEFAASNARGTSNTLGLTANYPLLRTHTRNLYANFQLERKGFDNQFNGTTESQYKSTLVGASLSGNASDALGGLNAGNIQWLRGQLNLNGSPTHDRDAAGAQTAGRFDKWRYSFSRQQPFTSSWSGYAALNGQLASKNLDSSEKFMLGGESGVRAYPGSEGVGAQGQVFNLEMRWRASSTDTWVAFYDRGSITLLRDNVSATALNAYTLKGAGLGWTTRLPGGANMKLNWARRIGSNPNPSSTGTDQDGSLLRNRYWLSASLPFSL